MTIIVILGLIFIMAYGTWEKKRASRGGEKRGSTQPRVRPRRILVGQLELFE